MKTIAHFAGEYAGELLIATVGALIRKIEIAIIKKKLRKTQKATS
jgi:hypothetical protein